MPRKKSQRKKSKPKNNRVKKSNNHALKRSMWLVTFLIAILLIGTIMYLDFTQFRDGKGAIFQELYKTIGFSEKTVQSGSTYEPSEDKPATPVSPDYRPTADHIPIVLPTRPPRPHSGVPRIAIIIDDMGYKTDIELKLLNLKWKLSFAVISNLKHSKKMAHIIDSRDRDLLLHLPMEPMGYPDINPGENALLVSNSFEENRLRLLNALDSVPFVIGINNHMGSRFTQDTNQMTRFLEVIRSQDLFFVDSRTTSKSVAYNIALKLGIPSAKRDVFLDHEDDYRAICDEVEFLVSTARSGSAIGIGHPRLNTLNALSKMLRNYDHEINVVPVSDLVWDD